MKVLIEQEFFAVLPPGSIRSIDEIRICPTKDLAIKIADEEEDICGQKMVILPVKSYLPMEVVSGELVVPKS